MPTWAYILIVAIVILSIAGLFVAMVMLGGHSSMTDISDAALAVNRARATQGGRLTHGEPTLIMDYSSNFFCMKYWGIGKMARILGNIFRRNGWRVQISSNGRSSARCFKDIRYYPYGPQSNEFYLIQLTTTDPLDGAIQIFRQVGKVNAFI